MVEVRIRRELAPTERSGSLEQGLDNHPVVHVAYRDAETYAVWAGNLPGVRNGHRRAARTRPQARR